MGKKIKITVLIILVFLFTVSNWLMDIYGNYFNADNGFFSLDYNQLDLAFHLVWYISIALFIFTALWLAYFIIDEQPKVSKKR